MKRTRRDIERQHRIHLNAWRCAYELCAAALGMTKDEYRLRKDLRWARQALALEPDDVNFKYLVAKAERQLWEGGWKP
jgi:hypothetical protein